MLYPVDIFMSPPTRAEWIEILIAFSSSSRSRSPPTRAEWIEIASFLLYAAIASGLRPHGRSGLKFYTPQEVYSGEPVSAHTGGVD